VTHLQPGSRRTEPRSVLTAAGGRRGLVVVAAVALIATSALTMKLVRHLSQKRRLSRVPNDHERQRDDVHRWEAEGGNLPSRPPAG